MSVIDVRVAIYARFSTDMQSKHSADDQIRECNEYAARQGWQVVLIEKDEAVRAGAVASREGYARIIDAAKRGVFDVLLVFEISRFSRDFLGGMVELSKITAAKVKIADTSIGLVDLDTAHGQMMVSVHLMSAHQDVRKLAINAKRGQKGKVLQKSNPGGKPAYGLKRVPVFSTSELDVDGRPKRIAVPLAPDPETAPVVLRIYQMYAAGCTKGEIARTLNRERIPTRDAGRIYNGKVNSGTWATASIKKILENEVYAGDRLYNKHSRTGDKHAKSGKKAEKPNAREEWIRVDDYVEAIIPGDLYEKVVAKLAADRAEYDRKGTGNKNRQYLLSGFLRCAGCGGSFVVGSYFRGTRQYRCSMRATRGKDVCSNTTCVPQLGLEARIKAILDAMSKDPSKLEALVAAHNDRVREFNSQHLAAVHRLEAQLGKAREALANVVTAIEEGDGPIKALAKTAAKREAEVEALEAQITKTKEELQPYLLPRRDVLADYVTGTASIFTGDFVADRAFLESVLEYIRIHMDGTVVLHFRMDSLFGPIAQYEIADAEPPAQPGDVVLEGFTWPAAQRAVMATHALLRGTPSRVVDFGSGLVLKYEPRAQNTLSVPSGTAEVFSHAIQNTSGVPNAATEVFSAPDSGGIGSLILGTTSDLYAAAIA